jgi:hypothetical protein
MLAVHREHAERNERARCPAARRLSSAPCQGSGSGSAQHYEAIGWRG